MTQYSLIVTEAELKILKECLALFDRNYRTTTEWADLLDKVCLAPVITE